MRQRLITYFLSTRPKFLSITALGVLIGFSIQNQQIDQPTNWYMLLTVLLLALLAHSAANVLNDYYDELNGSDKINVSRISPFTGGSRFIQDKILSPTQIRNIAITLFSIAIIGGIILCFLSSPYLIWIGILGIFLGWSYSANPMKLMSRGVWGEIAIILCWALIIIGSNLMQSSQINTPAIFEGLAYGLFIANILLVNQIPDIDADQSASKLTLAVKVGDANVWKWFLGFLLSANAIIVVGYFLKIFNLSILLTLCTLVLGINLSYKLKTHYANRAKLTECIKQTILLAHLFGLILLISNWL